VTDVVKQLTKVVGEAVLAVQEAEVVVVPTVTVTEAAAHPLQNVGAVGLHDVQPTTGIVVVPTNKQPVQTPATGVA